MNDLNFIARGGAPPLAYFFIMNSRNQVTFLTITITSIFLLFACNSRSDSVVHLTNGNEFKLVGSEKEREKNNTAIKQFMEFTSTYNTFQIPLFSYIQDSNYSIFIGLPVGVKGIPEIMDKFSFEKMNFQTDSKTYAYRYSYSSSNKTQYYEFFKEIGGSLYYTLIVEFQSTKKNSYFSIKSLSDRFIN